VRAGHDDRVWTFVEPAYVQSDDTPTPGFPELPTLARGSRLLAAGIAIRAAEVSVIPRPPDGHAHDPREVSPGSGVYGLHRYTMAGTAAFLQTEPQHHDPGFSNNFALTTETQAFLVTPEHRPDGLTEDRLWSSPGMPR
jgi:hypothetical protein